MVATTVRIDTTNLMRACQLLDGYSKFAPAEGLNKTVAFVVNRAKRDTPVTEIGRIDTELEVVTIPKLAATGKRKGLPLRSGKKLYKVVEGGMATNIVLARLHPFSRYNRFTDGKYAINQADFSPGMGAAGFWQRVEETAQRMTASRHSSTGFFKISWNAILSLLANVVPASYRGAVLTWAGSGKQPPQDMGSVTAARAGSTLVTCTIENRLGMGSVNPTLEARRNEAAHRILEPVLQRAINAEFEGKMQEFSRLSLRGQRAALAEYGMIVRI